MQPLIHNADRARAGRVMLAFHRGDKPALDHALEDAASVEGGAAALVFALAESALAMGRILSPNHLEEQLERAVFDLATGPDTSTG